MMPKNDSLFETVLVSANDTLVDLFLKKFHLMKFILNYSNFKFEKI